MGHRRPFGGERQPRRQKVKPTATPVSISIVSKDNCAWNLFRSIGANEDDVIKFWADCNVRTVDFRKIPRALWNQCLGVAAKRTGALSEEDPLAFALGTAFHKAMPRLILAKVKPVGLKASWVEIVKSCIQRFFVGKWVSLWSEGAPAVVDARQRKEMSVDTGLPWRRRGAGKGTSRDVWVRSS